MSKMPVYQIRDWDSLFENAGSRQVDQCRWAGVPNKQHGVAYRRTVETDEGMLLYAAFVGIILVASGQRKNTAARHKREGWLTDNGDCDGIPLSAADLHLKTGMPESVFAKALEYFSDPQKVGSETWLIRYIDGQATFPTPGAENKQTAGASGSQGSKGPGPETRSQRIKFDVHKGIYGYTPEDIKAWAEAYPGVDIMREIRSLSQWAIDNPTRRPRSKFAAFITRNLSRKQDNLGKYTSTKDQMDAQRKKAMERRDCLEREYSVLADDIRLARNRSDKAGEDKIWSMAAREFGNNFAQAKARILELLK